MPYKNKRKQKAAQREWYEANKDLTALRSASWKVSNPNLVKASNARYRKKNRKAIRKRNRKWANRQTAKLSDYYIAQDLAKHGIPYNLARRMPDLIECVRQHYSMVRLLKTMRNEE